MNRRRIQAWAGHCAAREAFRVFLDHTLRAGITVVPVKGILLAPLLYDDTLERAVGDVDVVVRYRDLRALLRLATTRGWPIIRDSTVPGCLNLMVKSVAMDVSTAIKPAGICAIGLDEMFGRTISCVAPLGFPHLQLEWHDHVLLVAADAFKDKLDAKPSVQIDLVRMVARPEFDPGSFVQRAVDARLTTMIAAICDWILQTHQSIEWSRIRAQLPKSRIRTKYLARWSALQVKRPDRGSKKGIELAIRTRLVSDSVPRRLLTLALAIAGTAAFAVRNGWFDAKRQHNVS